MTAAEQNGGWGRAARAMLAAATALLAAAALGAAPAAGDHHFCPQGSGPQQCERPAGVATDAEAGLVYIADEDSAADADEDRVQVFDEDGGFVRSIGAGVLSRPRGVAVDNDIGGESSPTKGDVFVIDGVTKPRVLRFSAAGELRLGFGWGVADGAPELQTCGPEGTPPSASCLPGSSEAKGQCQLTRRSQIAVGPGGRVFVSDSALIGSNQSEGFKNRLMRFAPDGASCEESPVFPEGSAKTINAIAVDSEAGSYLAVDREGLEIRRLDAGGGVECSLNAGLPVATALAVDPATDRLYAGHGETKVRGGGSYRALTVYEPGCAGEAVETVRRFGYNRIATAIRGLAALPGALDGGRAGDPVLSEGFGASFDTFHLAPPPPGPLIVPGSVLADPVSNTKATLGAELNAEGEQTEISIQYIEKAACEANEAGAGECFDGAATSPATTLAGEGFSLQGAEALFGCPDPLSEEGHPGETAYEAGECLEPETAYRFRAVAVNPSGDGNSPADGGEFETRPWLEFGAAWASSVGTGSVRLNAEVNPLGVPVSGRFEVVSQEGFEASGFAGAIEFPRPGEDPIEFGSGEDLVSRGVSLGGLEPGTAYRYRLVVQSPLTGPLEDGVQPRGFTTFRAPERLECPANEAFRTGAGALLPDCRGYELVSPLDKGGGNVIVLGAPLTREAVLTQSSTEGTRMAYGSLNAFADAPSAPWTSQYVAARRERGAAGEGWQSHAVSSPIGRPLYDEAAAQFESELRALSPDLCRAWIRGIAEPPLAAGARQGYPNLYRRSDEECGGPAYEALTTAGWATLPEAASSALDLELQGVSADGQTAAFVAPDALEGTEAPDLGPVGLPLQLYVHAAGAAAPVFACILPGGTAAGEPCSAGNGPAVPGTAGLGRVGQLQGALSADGERLFWTMGTGDGPIYLRQGAAQGSGPGECAAAGAPCTIEVSAAGEAASGTDASQFRAAARDGSRAVFSTNAAGEGEDLYLALIGETAAGHPTLAGSEQIAGEVLGVMGVSEEATHVYFASREAIAGSGEDALGEEAEAGRANLYLYSGGEWAFIGALSDQDVAAELSGPVKGSPWSNLARVSPGGGHAAFLSSAPLTGYDNADAATGQPTTQAFRYEAGADRLICASCNPGGARPAGRDNAGQVIPFGPPRIAAWIEGHQTSLYVSRELSDDGGRLFFNSTDPLVARDTNGRADVYQWEAPGRGSCQASSPSYSTPNGGCIELISSGQSAQDSEFLDASADGDDVFFTTLANLVPADYDLVDVYDARVGGGFPPPPPPPAECEGEACQSPPAPPDPPAPASSGYPRSDDIAPDLCAAGAKRAQRLSRAARRARQSARATRRRARRNPALAKRARRLAAVSKKRAKRARRLAGQTRRCRRAERRRAAR